MTPEAADIRKYFRHAIGVYVFLLVLAMYPYTNDPTGDIKGLLTSWAAFLLVGGWFLAAWRFKIPFERPRIFLEVLVCFLIFYAIATLRSPFTGVSLMELNRFVFLGALYLVGTQVYRTAEDIQGLLKAATIAVFLAALYAFCQLVGLDPFPWDDRESDVYTNLPATFGNPNFAAHTLILVIIGAAYLGFMGRAWAWVAVAAFVVHLRFTDQRAGLIALGAGVLLILAGLVSGRFSERPIKRGVVTLATVALIGVLGAAGAMTWSHLRTGTAFPLDLSLLLRYQSYVSASDMLLDAPLGGHGPGVYALAYPEYWTAFEQEWFAQELRMNAHVHNDLIELAIDAGLPAAGLYLALLVLGMGHGLVMAFTPGPRQRRWLGYAFAGIFMAFLVDGLFGFNLRVPVSAGLLFLFMGALDGAWIALQPARERAVPGWLSKTLKTGVVAVLAVLVVIDSRVFASEYLLQRGMAAENKRNFDVAAERYHRGEDLARWNWNFAYRLGLLSIKRGQMEQAVEQLERSLEINPHHFMSHLPLAHAKTFLARRLMEKRPTGEDDLEPIPEDLPEELDVEATLNHLDEAANHARAVLAICPVFPRAEEILGRIASISAVVVAGAGKGQLNDQVQAYWRQAQQHLEKAIRYGAANQGELYEMLAKVRMALGKGPQAEQALVRAVQTAPDDVHIWPFFLEFANNQGRYDRIREALYDQIEGLRENEEENKRALATLHLILANVLENGYDDLAAAEDAYREAVRYGPRRNEVWSNFARFAFAHDRESALLEAVARSCAELEAQEKDPLAHVAAVNAVLQEGGRALDSASTTLMTRFRAHPARRAMTAEQAYGWAARLMLRTVQQTPAETACVARLNLGMILATLGRFEDAEILFAQAEPCLGPAHRPFLAMHWANTLVQLDRPVEAVNRLREAAERYPDNFDLRWTFARVLAKAGFPKEARAQYQWLLDQPESAINETGRKMIERELQAL